MSLQNPSCKQEQYELNYTITNATYTDDVITIDLDHEDILKDFDITASTITNNLSDGITISDNTAFNWNDVTIENPYQDLCEYVGIDVNLPPEDFEKMCKRYPALQKALEQFQNTYNLVKDDWRNDND